VLEIGRSSRKLVKTANQKHQLQLLRPICDRIGSGSCFKRNWWNESTWNLFDEVIEI